MELAWEQAAAWRAERHGLGAARAPATALVATAGRVCGLHAQLTSTPELSLLARLDGLEPGAVERALWEERSLVRTWAMRGTLHLLPSAELGLWVAGLSTYAHFRKGSWLRHFGLTEEQLDELLDVVPRVLDGAVLTREELAAAVAERLGTDELGAQLRESWGAVLKPVAFRAGLCFGPPAGRNVRFTAPGSWLGWEPGWESEIDGDAALDEIARRFLAAYGPASREDFSRWWAGLTPARAQRRFEGLGDEVVEVSPDGARRWMLAADAEAAARERQGGAPVVRLLPAFDPYVIGATRHAEALMPGPFGERVYRAQGWVTPVLLVDGRMEGVWRHERTGSRVDIEIEPFGGRAPARVREAAEAEAERLAEFLGGALSLRWVG